MFRIYPFDSVVQLNAYLKGDTALSGWRKNWVGFLYQIMAASVIAKLNMQEEPLQGLILLLRSDHFGEISLRREFLT